MSKYPTKIDDTNTLPLIVNGVTPVTSDSVNSLRSAIVNIQTELGTKPSATYTALRQRLDELENSIFGTGGSGLVKSPPSAIDGQILIYDGYGNWVPGNDFYDQNIVTTGSVNTSEFTSTQIKTGLISLSGKLVMSGFSPEPAVSNNKQGIIYFDGYNFMSSENGGQYNKIGYGLVPPPPDPFNAFGDLAQDPDPAYTGNNGSQSQMVVGIRGIKTENFLSFQPRNGQAILFRGGKWIAGTDFGANDIKTSSFLQTDTLTVSSFGSGVARSDIVGAISSKLIFDADIDDNAAINGTKIKPNFGSQNVKTNRNLISTGTVDGYLAVKKLNFNIQNSPELMAGTLDPSNPQSGSPETDGSIYINPSVPNLKVRKNGSWTLPTSSPSGPAATDLGGTYPSPTVLKVRGIPIQSMLDFGGPIPDGYVPQIKTDGANKKIAYGPIDLSLSGGSIGLLPITNQQGQRMVGDVDGYTDSAIVTSIHGKQISLQQPTDKQYLVFSAGMWSPITVPLTASAKGVAGGDLSGTYPNPTVLKINGTDIPPASNIGVAVDLALQASQITQTNTKPTKFAQIDLSKQNSIANKIPASKLDPQVMSGDIYGLTNNNKVIKIRGYSIKSPPQTLTSEHDGYFIFYNGVGTTPAWEIRPSKIGSRPTGIAGGDLSGTYPNPNVTRINGSLLPTALIPTSPYFIQVDANSAGSSPTLKYAKLDLSNPNSFTGKLPANKLDPQDLFGDLSNKVTTSVVSKVLGINIPAPSGATNRFLSLRDYQNFEYTLPTLNKVDGYINFNGISSSNIPQQSANKCVFYFDSTSKKFKVSENNSPWTDLSPDSTKKVITSNLSQAVSPSTNASLSSPRKNFSACKLDDGRILIIGAGSAGTDSKINVYDPYTNSFSQLNIDATYSRDWQANFIAPLTQNKAMVISGAIVSSTSPNCIVGTFDGFTSTYTTAPNTSTTTTFTYSETDTTKNIFGTNLFTVKLDNGDIWVGVFDWGTVPSLSACRYAMIYSNGAWARTAGQSVNIRRYYTATPLGNVGKNNMLICGGQGTTNAAVAQSEIYNVQSKTFSATSSMSKPRYLHTCTKIDGYSAIILGGIDNGLQFVSTSEIYDISSSTFKPDANLIQGRILHAATLLSNGNVLVTGGLSGPNFASTSSAVNTSEIYDFRQQIFVQGPNMVSPRSNHIAILLSNGKVLVVGGQNNGVSVPSAEIYDPSAGINGQFSLLTTSTLLTKLSGQFDMSSHTNNQIPDYLVLQDGSGTTANKSLYADVKLPQISNVNNGKTLTVCLSPYSANNDYTIKLSAGNATDVVLYNDNYNKQSITLVADKVGNRWIAMDNSG